MHTRELAWVSARSERYRPHANEKGFISHIVARRIEQLQAIPNEEVPA